MEFLKNFSPPPGYNLPRIDPRWPETHDSSLSSTYIDEVVQQRQWNFEDPGDFKVLQYNILADSCLEDPQFPRQNPNDLHVERRLDFILAEIEAIDADILTLQEVDINSRLRDSLVGYSNLYKKRTGFKNDGVMIAWKTDKVSLVEFKEVEFKSRQETGCLNRDNIGLIGVFEIKGKRVLVASTHIYYNYKRSDIQLSQVAFFSKCVAQVLRRTQADGVVLTGDLSFLPYSGLYRLLIDGGLSMAQTDKNDMSRREFCETDDPLANWDRIEDNIKAEGQRPTGIKDNTAGQVNALEIGCNENIYFPILGRGNNAPTVEVGLQLKDAFDELQFPTMFVNDNIGTFDYIFYGQKISPVRYLALPPKEQMQRTEYGLPNELFPSDHISLCVDFAFA